MVYAMLVHEDAKDALTKAMIDSPLAPQGSKQERTLRVTRRAHVIILTTFILLAVFVTAVRKTHGVYQFP
eukprot:SAG31_NODE_25291_length_464_cov_0.997260_1_plen_69_part_10